MHKIKFLQFFSNLKIRTSLMLILVLFFFMLVIGAGTGVGALYLSNQSLEEVTRYQQVRASLMAAMSSYKDVQVTLGRAVTSIMVDNNLDEIPVAESSWPGQAETQKRVLEVSDTTKKLIEQAREQYTETLTAFDTFRKQSEFITESAVYYNRAASTFKDLMDEGVEPLMGLLEQGNINEYQNVLEGTTLYLEMDVMTTVNLLVKSQERLINNVTQEGLDQYQLVLMLIAVGIAFALLVCILAYLFLGKMVLRPLRVAGEHFDHIAEGDLSHRIALTSTNEIGQLYAAMRRMQDGLKNVVSHVRAGVDEINIGATEIYRGNTDLSSRTEQQAASLQQTAASMEELDSTVKQNTDNALQADELSRGASDVALKGGSAVTAVVNTMQEIAASSSQMSEIVSVIDGIAFQTNILALNAAVEAARAGEQGRGFAVVAGEVRALAQRSAQAAREIKQLIDESVVKANGGRERANEAGQVMEEVVSAISHVTTIMAEIASASREQADGIGQVNQAVTEMDGVVQQNAALVEQAASAAGSLQQQANKLAQAVAFFNLGTVDVIDVESQEQKQLEMNIEDEFEDDEFAINNSLHQSYHPA